MATGLTFGSIAAQYRPTNHLVAQTKNNVPVIVVILFAFVPTLVAQQWFDPDPEGLDEQVEEEAGEEDLSALHHTRDGSHRPAATQLPETSPAGWSTRGNAQTTQAQ